jgi:hypothetical protein
MEGYGSLALLNYYISQNAVREERLMYDLLETIFHQMIDRGHLRRVKTLYQ